MKTARDLFTSAEQYQDAIDAGEQFINASRAWLARDPSVLTNLLNRPGAVENLTPTDAAEATDRAASFATQRLIPGIGLAVNAIATVDAFKEALNDPNLGNVVAVVGNATVLIGSAISLFPALPIYDDVWREADLSKAQLYALI